MSRQITLAGQALSCTRGGRKIFSNLSFSIFSGQALAVTGPNGSGKSSLLRMIAGLLTSEAGTISFSGGEHDLTLAEQAHFLGHRDGVKLTLTVAENVAFWSDFLGGSRLNKPSAALDAVGLGD